MKKFIKSFIPPITVYLSLLLIGYIFEISANAYIQLTLIYICINSIMAMSLNLVNGYTGQFSLGHAGFMAIGAYTSAYLSFNWIPTSIATINLIIYALTGGLLSAFAGLIVGLPSLRLKGDYLAIVTLGFGEIIRVILLNFEQVGGARGLYGIPGYFDIHRFNLQISRFYSAYILASFWVVATFFIIWRLIRSSYGRVFLSVKEDEIAAQAMGIDTTLAKVRAFILSSFFAGIAGSLFAHYTNYLNPSSFGFLKSIDAVIMVVLGGMGSLTGSVIAAAIVTILPEALRPLKDLTGVDLRMVIYSLALIVVMIMRPQGLFGHTEIIDLLKKRSTLI
ncbi:MAG TPA: branched-chain amino acid ABC transporter permease [Thermodesulfovibrionia bacterium]|nr:branched-chain amino acid ABC transporter permease [Thermodesulfovibrionia bacterium]